MLLALPLWGRAETSPPEPRTESAYAEQLVQQAQKMDLDRDRTWHALLHYAGSGERVRSRIPDPRFFLAPEGRTDSAAELAQTLRSFFLPGGKDGEHALCRFPARFQFLQEKLRIDPARLPAVTCTERDSLFETVDPQAAVLVFPVGHINSPASMFGHTLLRLDGTSKSSLISYAANYAAAATDSNGLLYAWRGIFGGYRGYYSLLPYYLKVKEYSDLEHRDMWEYPLKLSQPEVRRMLAHLWELQKIYSDYYFFDENCSYNLLFLIDAARPELRLTDKTGLWVLPSDTIDLARAAGVLGPAHYRPSQGTKIRRIAAGLDAPTREAAYRIARAELSPQAVRNLPVSAEERRQSLDLAAEFLQFRFAREEIGKEAYSRNYLKVLAERSRMGSSSAAETAAEPDPPDRGHGSFAVGTGAGVRRSDPYLELRLQPAYHSLLDPDQGYLPGAQLKFMEAAFLYNFGTHDVEVKSLHLLDIVSLAPRDRFFQPLSWKALIGADREAMRDGSDALLFRINTGGGFAHASPFGGIAYVMGELDFNAGGKIRGTATIGPALSVGDLEQIGGWWKVQFFLRGAVYELGDDRWVLKGGINQSFRVSQQDTVTLEVSQEAVNRHGVFEGALLWNRYF
ncbi:DUF4105 domain-containing protein [Geomonas sp. Red875]|uniref:DUF4105 domain-containing protein n=2 Tax=Geomesophilobacter sediminis TaxID=2798584 RepID=A0A8J7JF29_9BACT|nr:DUF4105 domain-containing protein [Geomesophilobacter sediminis]